MTNLLTAVLIVIYTLLVSSAAVSIVANHYRPPHISGPPGKEGSIGQVGTTGIPGNQGATGLTGISYSVAGIGHGFTGPIGPTGIELMSGATGSYGSTGPTGSSTGSTGQPGPRGPSPQRGLTGPTGAEAPRGVTGATGPSTPGPVSLNLLYTYNAPVLTPGSNIIPVTQPPMTFVRSLPPTIPPEFIVGPTGGTIGFNLAETSYLIRIGLDLKISGLASGWEPTTVSLNDFPSPPGMSLITLWPVATSPTEAVSSLGVTIVYTTPAIVPVFFNPELLLSMTTVGATTTIAISLLSITIEHAAP